MEEGLNLWLIGGGAVVGLPFGALAQRSRFCLVAVVSKMVLVNDHRHLPAYLAALAVAIIGTAGGCNIGNGLTGASTISAHSFLAFAAMLLGLRAGLWWLQRRICAQAP